MQVSGLLTILSLNKGSEMDLVGFIDRRGQLEANLKQIEQSFHIVTGHLAEVNYQIGEMTKAVPADETQVDDSLAIMDMNPVE